MILVHAGVCTFLWTQKFVVNGSAGPSEEGHRYNEKTTQIHQPNKQFDIFLRGWMVDDHRIISISREKNPLNILLSEKHSSRR